jgi:hypothetical protein
MKHTFSNTFKQKIGVVDQQSDIIKPGAIKPREFVPLLNNFDVSDSIGVCTSIREENNELIIEAEILDHVDLSGMAHGISFKTIKSHKEGEITVIDEAELYAVSIIPEWQNVNPL